VADLSAAHSRYAIRSRELENQHCEKLARLREEFLLESEAIENGGGIE
jgi:hypothetical protein